MKKVRFISLMAVSLFFLLIINTIVFGQTTLVNWDFPNNPDDTIADGGIAINSSRTISNSFGGTLTYPAGVTSQSISSTSWQTGSGTKYWLISFSSQGYSNITISSAQKSSNSGPRDFKIQYSLDNTVWTDLTVVPTIANDTGTPWSGTVTNFALPAEANNQTVIFVRWIMTSDIAVSGATVASGGTSRIDNILINGTLSSAASGTVAGRVKNEKGRGLSRVTVMITGGGLSEPLYATTNSFGNYQFEDVPLGNDYVLQVFSRRYTFGQTSMLVNLSDSIADADFIGSELR